ncbi:MULTISPECIES: ROK family protein [Enterococcus]|uniref:ROK family protein n=1 Tax=Enterococcus TaxID=1350 RepID=UPI001126454C|nr:MULTISPECIES: ROK family protein [unclassified Enterococcus]MBK0038425.1 ROK family protein [Enterococcus sp. S52]MBK0071175.1 ROK family protein [Enterococcus sp. S53]MBK0141700.1 ROK family protein [Enterococcus sp. S76]MBK0145336.1 ROK family protein [Enterococcus sp. S77]TPR55369.1 ROK family protein [Enterococcus sp. OL5]
MAILVFDMGGSAVKYGVWSQDSLVSKGKFTTPNTWEEMKAQLQQVRTSVNEEIEGVGISAPGAVNAQERRIDGISAIPYIHGFDIYSELEAAFGVPVTIENDANCAGMAEFYQGAGKEFQQAAFVVIGTGVGGTLFQNGELVRGAHLYGGEFGLMILDQGKTFSQLGTAVQMAWRYCDRIGVDRATITGEEVFQRAEDGDAIAIEEVNKFYRYLAQGLFSIQFAFDPEVIIIGGGVSAKKGLLQEVDQRLKKMLADQALNDFVPLIKLCDYRNDANLVGAAANFQALYPRNSR